MQHLYSLAFGLTCGLCHVIFYGAPFEQAKAVSRAFEFRKDLRMTKFEICVSMTIRTKYKTVSRAFEIRKGFVMKKFKIRVSMTMRTKYFSPDFNFLNLLLLGK